MLVSLTPAGRVLRERVPDIQRRVGVATGLSRGDIAELRATLDVLTRQLRAADVTQPTGNETPTPPRVSAL